MPRFVSFARPDRTCFAEKTGSPRFLENPRVHASLFDPGRISGPGHSGGALLIGPADVAFCCLDGLGSCHFPISGLNHAAFTLAVYASRPGSPSVVAQDSLPAWWPTFAGRDFNPLGSIVRFRSCFSTWRSPHPGFAWRTEAKEGEEPYFLYGDDARRRHREGIGEKHRPPDMVGRVKVLVDRFFFMGAFFLPALLETVKTTCDAEKCCDG